MNKKTIIKYAVIHAIIAVAYIAFVAGIMANGEKLFGKGGGALQIGAMLLLFVLSAAVMGIVIFGRPAIWYFNGSKKEAVTFLLFTVGFLALIALIVFLILALLTKVSFCC